MPISSHRFSTLSSTMANESIYYVFSRRIPCLRESEDQINHFVLPGELTCPLTELSQQDRLIDSQIYLKVLNQREVQIVVQHAHLCSSSPLLLASLLRVSVCSNLSACKCEPNLPSRMLINSPSISALTRSVLHKCSTPLTSAHATSHRPLGAHLVSPSSLPSPSDRNRC